MAVAMSLDGGSNEVVVVNGAGPVGLMFSVALLDRATQLRIPKPRLQIWDPIMTPWREVNIKLTSYIASLLPEQVQMDLWEETVSSPKRLFLGNGTSDVGVENSRVHDPYNVPSSQYMAIVQVKEFQESMIRYLQSRHSEHCSFNQGRCPPDMMAGSAAVMQTYGKAARQANPIAGNAVAEEKPLTCFEAECPHGLFVLFERGDVAKGVQYPEYRQNNQRHNGFNVFQSHRLSNAVQTYIWPEDVNNDTGSATVPTTHEQLINDGRSFGLRALFDCVSVLQGAEDWWWEMSRRCRLQEGCGPVPAEMRCSLDWRKESPGSQHGCFRSGEKAGSAGFEAWFNAVRYQIALNMYRMGIFGTHAEEFLDKVRLCYARREPYYFNSVFSEVQGVPIVYLGDSAGSTDFKKGMSCGRGLLCASKLAFATLDSVVHQAQAMGCVSLKDAFRHGAEKYQQLWSSTDIKAEWVIRSMPSASLAQVSCKLPFRDGATLRVGLGFCGTAFLGTLAPPLVGSYPLSPY